MGAQQRASRISAERQNPRISLTLPILTISLCYRGAQNLTELPRQENFWDLNSRSEELGWSPSKMVV